MIGKTPEETGEEILDSLLEYLDSLDEEFGPVSPQEQEAAQRWWNDMKPGR
jgi:hypothetical protein